MKREKIQMMAEFMQGLNCMTDAAGQMIHQQQGAKWMAVRDMLQVIRDAIAKQNPGMGKQ